MLKSLSAQVVATSLTHRQRVALFCAAACLSHKAVGLIGHVMHVLVIRGLLEHRDGRYVLTEQGRDVFDAVLHHSKDYVAARSPGATPRNVVAMVAPPGGLTGSGQAASRCKLPG